jgi:hypothetical protein
MSRRRAVSVPGPTEAELHRFHLFVMTGKDDAGKEKGNARPPAPVSFDAIVRAADNTIVRFDPQLGVTEAELRALRGEREREREY